MRPIILILAGLLLAPIANVTAGELPSLEAGQSVTVWKRNPDVGGFRATVVRIDSETITLEYLSQTINNPLAKNRIKRGSIIAVPLVDIVKIKVKSKPISRESELTIAYIGLVALLLLPVVLWSFFFYKYDKEQRRQRFQMVRVPLMTFLGGIVGIFVGGALNAIMGLENYEWGARGGTGGIPADTVSFIGCMLTVGAMFYSRAKKRQDMEQNRSD